MLPLTYCCRALSPGGGYAVTLTLKRVAANRSRSNALSLCLRLWRATDPPDRLLIRLSYYRKTAAHFCETRCISVLTKF